MCVQAKNCVSVCICIGVNRFQQWKLQTEVWVCPSPHSALTRDPFFGADLNICDALECPKYALGNYNGNCNGQCPWFDAPLKLGLEQTLWLKFNCAALLFSLFLQMQYELNSMQMREKSLMIMQFCIDSHAIN